MAKEGDVDKAQIERAKNGKPGALWHIFRPQDTPKIRELMLKVYVVNLYAYIYTSLQ